MTPAPTTGPKHFPTQVTADTVQQAVNFYRDHLLHAVMPFWEKHSPDPEHAGFVHCLDRTGKATQAIKNTWCQGRQTWMFAALHRDLEPRASWMALAERGRDHLVKHAWAGNGHFHYQTDRAGKATDTTASWFTDAFALQGLCAWRQISGDSSVDPIIEQTFAPWAMALDTPGFNQFHHFELSTDRQWHAPWMVMLALVPDLQAVLGAQRIEAMARKARHKVLHVFVRDQQQMLFECLDHAGHPLKDRAGQTVNPGHALESLWFAMEDAAHCGDKSDHERAVMVARWVFDKGWDAQCGGLLAFVDPQGNPPPGHDQPANAWGEKWDDKVWWVHAEALYTVARCALATGDAGWYERWQKLHDETFRRFPDPEHGEWYEYFDRCAATPRTYDKGRWIKCAFHIPRALMKLACLPQAMGMLKE